MNYALATHPEQALVSNTDHANGVGRPSESLQIVRIVIQSAPTLVLQAISCIIICFDPHMYIDWRCSVLNNFGTVSGEYLSKDSLSSQ